MYFKAQVEKLRGQLQDEFLRRRAKNSSYSLRALARDLELDPSQLSRFLRRRSQLSLNTYEKLHYQLEGTANAASEAVIPEDSFKTLEADKFRVISDWYHFALLELVRTRNFRASPSWIARRLGISAIEAQIAIDRLLRLGLLKLGPRGKLSDAAGDNSSGAPPKHAGEAFRKLQRQVLTQALQRLEDTPFADRDHSSITVAVSRAQLPALQDLLQKFRKQFARQAQTSDDADEVYTLALALFPCTKLKKKESGVSV